MHFQIQKYIIQLKLRSTTHQIVNISIIFFNQDDPKAWNLKLLFPLFHHLHSLHFSFRLVEFYYIEGLKYFVKVGLEFYASRILLLPIDDFYSVRRNKINFQIMFAVCWGHEFHCFEKDTV